MRILSSIIFIILFSTLSGYAQADSVIYTPGMKMEDGVYLSYYDLRYNKPILKEQIVATIDKDQLEFIGKTVFNEKFSYKINDNIETVDSKKIWGYVQNNTFYVNYKGDFYRIPVFGSISYLVANVTVMTNGFYDPRFGYMGSTTAKEVREFLLDYNDGIMTELTSQRVEQLLGRDLQLYAEFEKLNRRKQKEQLYKFIRRYNELHPAYFLN